jgi:hypothetical protein
VLGLHAWNEIGNAYHRAPLIRRKQGGLVGLTCSPHKEHLRWEQRPWQRELIRTPSHAMLSHPSGDACSLVVIIEFLALAISGGNKSEMKVR